MNIAENRIRQLERNAGCRLMQFILQFRGDAGVRLKGHVADLVDGRFVEGNLIRIRLPGAQLLDIEAVDHVTDLIQAPFDPATVRQGLRST